MSTPRWCIVLSPFGAARTVSLNIADAFSRLLTADNCKIIDPASYLAGYQKLLATPDQTTVIDLFNQTCTVMCLDFQPTYCLVGALAPITLYSLILLRKYHIVTCHWFYEDYYKATYWRSVLPGYDHFFAVQHGAIEAECNAASTHFHFLPTATACGKYDYTESNRDIGVLFIGIPSSYRIAVLETLFSQQIPLAIGGTRWDTYKGVLESCIFSGQWIGEERSFQVMRRSRIGLNLSSDYPHGRSDLQTSPRVFDYSCAGCVVVSDASTLLSESAPDIPCHTFTDLKTLSGLVRRILDETQFPAETYAAVRTKVLERHTYINRAQTMLDVMATQQVYSSSKNSNG